MKEKILAQLKLACGETTSISDRTLETLATMLSVNVTEESQIAALVESQKPLLKEMDGNINFIAAEAVKKVKPVEPPSPPSPPVPPTPPVDQEPSWFKKYREDNAAKFAEIEAAQAQAKKKEAADALIADARKNFYGKYKFTESEKKIAEKALTLALSGTQEFKTSDEIIEAWKPHYEDFRSVAGLGSIEPISANDGAGGRKKANPIIENVKKNLQAQGKLPVPEKQN